MSSRLTGRARLLPSRFDWRGTPRQEPRPPFSFVQCISGLILIGQRQFWRKPSFFLTRSVSDGLCLTLSLAYASGYYFGKSDAVQRSIAPDLTVAFRSAKAAFIRFILTSIVMFAITSATATAEEAVRPRVVLTPEAAAIHAAGMLFDGHNDLPWEIPEKGNSSFDNLDIAKSQPSLHTDIARLRQGGVKAQFWSVFVPADHDKTGDALLQTLHQISIVKTMMQRYPETFELASNVDDIERIVKSGKVASMMGVEGGYSIENELSNLQRLYDEGCRYMTLTHSKSLQWADSATDEPVCHGLSDFGREVVLEMNRLGMLVDLSHVSPETMKAALATTKAPVIFSHSSARAICDHPRNVPDDVLPLVSKNGGVVMVNFYSAFIVPTEELTLDKDASGSLHDVVDHIVHLVAIAGIDHVGIGSDFDGVPRLPDQLESVATYPLITQELMNRGYDQESIHKILGGNVMRVLRKAEDVAKQMVSDAGRGQ